MSGPTVTFKIDLKRRQAPTAAASSVHSRRAPAIPHSPVAPSPSAPASSAARVLALAHYIDREVRAGRFTGYRDAARRLGVSHTRVQHVVGLVFLPPAIQADVLLGPRTFTERELRRMAALPLWGESLLW